MFFPLEVGGIDSKKFNLNLKFNLKFNLNLKFKFKFKLTKFSKLNGEYPPMKNRSRQYK